MPFEKETSARFEMFKVYDFGLSGKTLRHAETIQKAIFATKINIATIETFEKEYNTNGHTTELLIENEILFNLNNLKQS